ncbi:DUF4192 domain-containing protein [Streptomyces sp. BI20]|uniref:DUF4192 domain-containing protein n=1 Tax=Streptomyces sp. BI20 TaxID=3403460 RepID=UPI003C790150
MTHSDEPRTNHTPHEALPGAAAEPPPGVALRDPGELADALPYLLGYHPTDSLVLLGLRDDQGRLGARLRVPLPEDPRRWDALAEQVAACLVEGSERHGARPRGAVLYLCRDPRPGQDPVEVARGLEPLARRVRLACGSREVPVVEALCLAAGRWWSYLCPDPGCCSRAGTPLPPAGSSVMAATATYAGLRIRGTLRDLEADLAPVEGPRAEEQLRALDRAAGRLVPRMLNDAVAAEEIRAETLALAEELMRRLTRFRPRPGWGADPARDEALIDCDEAATLILGLQDRDTRDAAAEWMEGAEAAPALRLWRTLARRCVGAYAEHAAAPLALAGWVSWSTGDEPTARIALGLALRADERYQFARLLHHACNEGLDPERLRTCLRESRAARAAAPARPKGGPGGPAGVPRPRTAPEAVDGPPEGPSGGPRTRVRPRRRPPVPRSGRTRARTGPARPGPARAPGRPGRGGPAEHPREPEPVSPGQLTLFAPAPAAPPRTGPETPGRPRPETGGPRP